MYGGREGGREAQGDPSYTHAPGIECLEALAIEPDNGRLVGEFDGRVDVLGRSGPHGGVCHGCLPALPACLWPGGVEGWRTGSACESGEH